MKSLPLYLLTIAISITLLILTSCDGHHDVIDTSIQPGHILLTTGQAISPDEYKANGGTPIAVVFYTSQTTDGNGTGYAVYLHDIDKNTFTDSIGIKQNTSADITTFDGNTNTYAMFTSGISPIADAVYDMWQYGQSAYIPSVAQLRLLYSAKESINPYIELCGGTPLPDSADECWYWSSTEVEGQEMYKAWLYSMGSGAIQETPKEQKHKVRPIVTLNN